MLTVRLPSRSDIKATVRDHKLLFALLGAGVVLRTLLAVWFWPVNGGFLDSGGMLLQEKYGIFRDPLRVPGYPFLLRILSVVTTQAFAIVLLQYVMGLATAAMLYWIVWKATANKFAAAIPAGYVLLSGDHLLVEHSILTEASTVFFTTVALTLWFLASRADRKLLWVLTGAAWTVAATTRFGPVILLPVLAGTLLIAPGAWRNRARYVALMVAGALPFLVAWGLAQGDSNGHYVPGYSATGWSLYSRVAQFANCSKWDVADDLRFLCEDPSTIKDPDPAKRRGGAGYYLYLGGPAVKRFGAPTPTEARGADVLQRFAIATIIHQPLDYLRTVTSDMLRYFDRGSGYDRAYSGANSDEEDLSRRSEGKGGAEEFLHTSAEQTGWDVPPFRVDDEVGMLEDWQRIMRLNGFGLLVVLLLGIGAAVRRGPGQRMAVLFVGTGIVYAALPALTQTTAYRHSIPAFCFLVAGAAILIGRVLEQRRTASPPSEFAPNPVRDADPAPY
jgi:hypothetical protein